MIIFNYSITLNEPIVKITSQTKVKPIKNSLPKIYNPLTLLGDVIPRNEFEKKTLKQQ